MDEMACRLMVLEMPMRVARTARMGNPKERAWVLSDEAAHWAGLLGLPWPPPGIGE